MRRAAACLLGAAVPLSGFNPLNNAGDQLNVDATAWHVIAMPATLIGLAALGAGLLWRARPGPPPSRWLVLGAALLVLGAGLSLIHAGQGKDTFAQIVTAVLAPVALFAGLRRADLPPRAAGLAFAVTAAALLLRADMVFFAQKGFPTGTHLLQAKESFEAHDFHYYGLQNPVGTSIFTVTLLAFAALWLAREREPRARAALGAVSLVALLTLYLLYERIGIAIGLVIAACVLVKLAGGRRWGVAGIAVLLAAFALIALTGPGVSKQLGLLHTSSEVRWNSLWPGVKTVFHHPLTGLGLGWASEAATHRPAHSSVIQAGVEMGIFGLLGVALLTCSFLATGWRALRDRALDGMRRGALVATGLYALYTLVAGGVNAGLNDGLVSVWALSIALMAAIAQGSPTAPASGR